MSASSVDRRRAEGIARAAGPLALVAVLLALAAVRSPAAATAQIETQADVPPVSLVPIGGFRRGDASTLARSIAHRLGLRVSVLPAASIPQTAFDPRRKQYVAEKLITLLRKPINDPRVVVGLTPKDMYTTGRPDWRYTFSIRSPQGFAVVSSARMDPAALGLLPDPQLRLRRLEKMVLKNIGVLAYGRSPSRNPRSVLYDSILSPDDLDFMSTDFAPQAPSRARSTWLRRTGVVCTRGVSQGKALVARLVITGISTRADFLAFARESIKLDASERRQLAAIPPAQEDRASVRALLGLYAREGREDRATLARLSSHWNTLGAQRWLQDGVRYSLTLKSEALELGSKSCARYFDPATYSR